MTGDSAVPPPVTPAIPVTAAAALDENRARRDAALKALSRGMPYAAWMGIHFDRRGDELTAIMRFHDRLIGNPVLPALHGGAISAFLETTAIVELAWAGLLETLEAGAEPPDPARPETLPRLPKTIDFTVDFLRSGQARDAFARARVVRQGRRYASVHVEAWQDNRSRLFAQATGHFLMPRG